MARETTTTIFLKSIQIPHVNTKRSPPAPRSAHEKQGRIAKGKNVERAWSFERYHKATFARLLKQQDVRRKLRHTEGHRAEPSKRNDPSFATFRHKLLSRADLEVGTTQACEHKTGLRMQDGLGRPVFSTGFDRFSPRVLTGFLHGFSPRSPCTNRSTQGEHQWIVAQRLLSARTIPGFK